MQRKSENTANLKKTEDASNLKIEWKSANQIRRLFLDYFKNKSHQVVASSSLVPQNDPTLLFTNSGMVQFKDVFLGKEERNYKRATSSQKCIRAGGKHNDLENVGYTARHHTFFEMLGNFSFGDYFKREAIQLAWQFLTEELKLPVERLWVTIFQDDQEAENIWLNEIRVDRERFRRCGEKDNFWAMGPTGPCGPCTEIYYDHGPQIAGGPPGSEDSEGDRYVEIWNLVFMQYERAQDGSLTPLPKPSVDTGMGLERIAAVMQGVHNNYDIDLFKKLIDAIADIAKIKDKSNTSLRVIADHIRSCAFLIADGVIPSNEGRGYVLRRIIRRALRHGHQLGIKEPFFYKLVQPLTQEMGEAYPQLTESQSFIEKTLRQEEEQFTITLSQGVKLFDQAVGEKQPNLKGKIISGETVFKLYDTYGFPADLTADMARELGLSIDFEGFETLMSQQRERSRQASKFQGEYAIGANIEKPTDFLGYKDLTKDKQPDEGKILAIYKEGAEVNSLKAGEQGSIILDRTPFYAESGGQVGDQGILKNDPSEFQVDDTKKQGQAHVHIGKLIKGELKLGDNVTAKVDAEKRAATVLNHSATHILHMVLRKILGSHVLQKGSLVEPKRLRFDFSHTAPLSTTELKAIELTVNAEIRKNSEAIVHVTTPEAAIQGGALGLFGEKYGDEVRVVQFGDSKELCGGTHAHHTGDIGVFKITSEAGIAAGVRRIEAVTGEGALKWIEQREINYQNKLKEQDEHIRTLEKQIEQLKVAVAGNIGQDLASKAKQITDKNDHKIKVLIEKVEGIDAKSLRNIVDQLKHKLGTAIILLSTAKDQKVSVVAGVTKDLTNIIKANELVNIIGEKIGGKGGGRADMAEAGGSKPEQIEPALQYALSWITNKITN